jgi:hypothetical protein
LRTVAFHAYLQLDPIAVVGGGIRLLALQHTREPISRFRRAKKRAYGAVRVIEPDEEAP